MPAECRPPEGTPDGALCVLVRDRAVIVPPREYVTAIWGDGYWWKPNASWWRPREMADVGWRFHSLAAVAPLIAAAERERCAKVADQGDADYRPAANNPGSAGDYWKGKADAYRAAAAAIRARGEKP